MLEVKKYDLVDIELLTKQHLADLKFFVWQPDRVYIVLGSSNKMEDSLQIDHVLHDKAAVLKRPSGGESVLLTPQTIVLATLIHTQKLEDPPSHFRAINSKIISILEAKGVHNLSHKGISDIAIGNKKILGSSIYRRTNLVFYHAVLNVSESTSLMERYLTHPKKQPDYRLDRKHHDFVTSLKAEGYHFEMEELKHLFTSA